MSAPIRVRTRNGAPICEPDEPGKATLWSTVFKSLRPTVVRKAAARSEYQMGFDAGYAAALGRDYAAGFEAGLAARGEVEAQ